MFLRAMGANQKPVLDCRVGTGWTSLPLPTAPPPPPLSAQISATTKRGCRPWAGSPWGPGNRGADLLLPPPPPQQKWGRTESRPSTPPPQHAFAPSLQAVLW